MHPKYEIFPGWLVFCLCLINAVHSQKLKVFQSTVKIEEFGVISGATLSKGSTAGNSNILDGFTICGRFKLKIMGSFVNDNDMRGIVFKIGDSLERELITFAARTNFAFLNVGHVKQRNSFDSYFLQDEAGNYEIIIPQAWHHWCYSYNTTGYSQMVLVSRI